jgi:hypothetical protein
MQNNIPGINPSLYDDHLAAPLQSNHGGQQEVHGGAAVHQK